MRRLLVLAIIVTGLCGQVWGQDAGTRDTLKLEGDTLILGQSVPLTLTVVNDNVLSMVSTGLLGIDIVGGYAKFDSVTFINRMADQRQLGFRVIRFRSDDGIEPDTLVIYASTGTSPEEIWLQPGNTPVAQVWMTGTQLGAMQVDTTFYPPGGLVWFGEYPNWSHYQYHPVFTACDLVVIEGTIPPVLEIPDDDIRIAAGTPISLNMPAYSPEGFPVSVSLTDFSEVYGFLTPSSSPVLGSGNPVNLSWTPTSADIGIWKVSLQICDSTSNCRQHQFSIQVVQNGSYLISFEIQEMPDAQLANMIEIGNVDSDANPEVVVSGDAFLDTDPLSIYNLNTLNEFEYVTSMGDPNYMTKAGRLAYLDSDDYLDLVTGRGGPALGHAIVTYLGDGNNGFIQNSVQSAPATHFTSAIAGEFNGDQFIDYVGTSRSGTNIYVGDGTGDVVFNNAVATDSSHAIDAADFDGDGDKDLAIGTKAGLNIFLNDGAGNFTLAHSYSQNFASTDLDITNQGSDFNNDDFYDICLAAPAFGMSNSEVVIYLGNGDGSFSTSVLTAPTGILYGNCIADFNYDGELDIALINNSEAYISFLFGVGDGTFGNELRFGLPQYKPTAFACSDIDLDGDIDLFVTSMANDNQRATYYYKNQVNPANLSRTTIKISAEDNAAIELVSPTNRVINSVKNTISSGVYRNRNLNNNSVVDDYLTIAVVEDGPYVLNVTPKTNVARATNFSLEFIMNGELFVLARDQVMGSVGYQFNIYPTGISPVVPAPGRTTYRNPTTLSWEGSGTYDLQLARDIQFNNLVSQTTVNGTSFVTPTLDTSSTANIYYWRIKPTGQPEYDVVYPFRVSLYSCELRGDVNHDGKRDIVDLTFLVDFMFRGGQEPFNPEEGDIDASGTTDISDLTELVSYLFRQGATPVPCL